MYGSFEEMLKNDLKEGKHMVVYDKSARYNELVEMMKSKYDPVDYSYDPKDTNIPTQYKSPYMKVNENLTCICEKEINLWTYWQGFGYAEKTPQIKYLLVGQDWGNPFLADNKKFINRIIGMNNGNKNIPYIDVNDKIYSTDKNLIELFKILGYSDIANNRYEDLFFTNFCLAYRTGKESGNVPDSIMKESAPLFSELCRILEPKNILCLGKQTFKYVYETLNHDKEAKTLKHFNKKYNDFLEYHEDFKVKCGNADTTIYPLAHSGDYGTMNRNYVGIRINKDGKREKIYESDTKDLSKQKQDWAKIAINNQ